MNLQRIRQDTPYCEDKLFLNSAGASLMPGPVIQKIKDYLDLEQQYGGYKVADNNAAEIREFYTECAQLLNTDPKNIAFAFNATDAYGRVLSSIAFRKGQAIITTDDDYVSNYLNFIRLKEKCGIEIHRIRKLESGDLDLDHVNELTTKLDVALVAVTHVPTNTGLIQDVESVGLICREKGLLYLVDACQSVGQLEVDVTKIHCDFLSATGRKFLRGPRGTGLLFTSDRVLEMGFAPLLVDLRAAEWTDTEKYELTDTAARFEIWELPYALLMGLKEAFRYLNRLGIDAVEKRNAELRSRLSSNLSAIKGVRQFDLGTQKASILSFSKEGKSEEQTWKHLEDHGVFCGIAVQGNALIDLRKKNLDWVVRLSPHYFNTPEEMDRVSRIIESL